MSFVVGADDAGKRLDQVLAANVEGLSRRRARVLLDIGGVFVDRTRVKVASRKVRAGQKIEAVLGGAFERATKKTGRAARDRDEAKLPDYEIVFEDEHIVVVNKPAGLLTAPTPESDRNNLADLLARRSEPAAQIWVVHRLDLPTSGLLVFAKTSEANKVLADAVRAHRFDREYLAVVSGSLDGEEREVDEPVGGKPASTHLRKLRALGEDATEIVATLRTGRTHQIRIHCESIGHPVLGDPQYGPRGLTPRPPRMALHATRLGLTHPATGESLEWTRPWPADLQRWLDSA